MKRNLVSMRCYLKFAIGLLVTRCSRNLHRPDNETIFPIFLPQSHYCIRFAAHCRHQRHLRISSHRNTVGNNIVQLLNGPDIFPVHELHQWEINIRRHQRVLHTPVEVKNLSDYKGLMFMLQLQVPSEGRIPQRKSRSPEKE